MVPKFRGNSEDWLDQTEAKNKGRSAARKKKTTTARATQLPREEANATVAEVFQNQCRVRMDSPLMTESSADRGTEEFASNFGVKVGVDVAQLEKAGIGEARPKISDDQVELLCSYRRANVVGKSLEFRERTPVAVGDRVLVQATGGATGVIEGICLRNKTLSRFAPGREVGQFQHILAANVDLLVIVASAVNPVFSPFWVDRLIVAAASEGIEILLCITKVDLLSSENEKPWQMYADLGYTVAEVCAKKNLGIAELTEKLIKKTVVFCGQSGVGKTSLLRVLTGKNIGKVGLVNESTGQGRHTTTSAILLPAPHQSQWIDTPGMREFDLVHLAPEELRQCFPEFNDLTCEQKDCLHLEESGCQARSLLRYSSYRKIYDSLSAS